MIHLEGLPCVMAALKARRRRIQVVLLKHDIPESKTQDLRQAAEQADIPIKRVGSEELNALAHGKSHGGVMAVCAPIPRWTGQQLLDYLPAHVQRPLLLMLEGVDDARNLGFTLRTADAVGVHAVLIKKHLWDFDETEVARSSSGALERVPLVQFDQVDLLQALQKQSIRIYGCLAGAKRSVFERNLTHPVCLCIGGEKRGLSGAVREACDRFISIPTIPGASTLSLSHASAIVMGEALRQRHRTGPKS
jgi:23S rRNA (guanosine2251-2'-O)-methyltransferase